MERPPQNAALAAELLARRDADQEVRSVPVRRWTDEDRARVRDVDAGNTAAMRRIIDAHGWPGLALVGAEAAAAAWLLVQHADLEPEFQQRALGRLDAAVAAGDAEPAHAAYLSDRCRVAQGEPQLYGTQFFDDGDGRGFRPYPIDSPDGLDERRAAVGMEPFADYVLRLQAME